MKEKNFQPLPTAASLAGDNGAELREESRRLEMALAASHAGTWSLMVECESLEWDNRSRVLFGFENDVPVSFAEAVARLSPESRSVFLENFHRSIQPDGGNVWSQEFRIDHPTQGERWLAGLGSIERDDAGHALRMSGINLDITGRKQMEEAMRGWNQTLERRVAVRTAELKQSEDRFRQLVDATFEGVVISENGVIIDGNPQIARMVGGDFAAMIGRPVTDFIAPESRALVLKRISEGFEAPYEYTGLRLDGTKVAMEAHGRVMDWQGKEARVTALRDLTSKKLAEARSEAQKAELDQALRLALVSEVSAGIIHQIGQPLSAIGANLAAAVVRFKAGGVTNRETLQLIEETALNVARMRDSVIHLRALADPEQPNRMPVNFNGLVSNTLHLIQAEADSLRFHLTTEMAPDLPPLHADAVQLSQVVINLVRNALDACADCPPEQRAVHIRTRALGDRQLELCVRDSGTGIAPAVMDHLYSPFFTTKPDGFGIGLRLSRTIVKAHGGTIEGSNNSDGIGATFRVILPLEPE